MTPISWFTVLWSAAATASLVLAAINLSAWYDLRRRDIWHLLFSIMAMGAAATAVIEFLLIRAGSVDEVIALTRWNHVPLFVLLVSMTWFVYSYFQTARKSLALTITVLWVITLFVNFLQPSGIVFSEVTGLSTIESLLGETYVVPLGRVNPWKWIPDAATLIIVAYVIDAAWRLWKSGDRRRAARVGGGIAFFIITAGIHTPLVDAGIVRTPYMISLAFVAIIVVMGRELSKDVVGASLLTRRVEMDARRWQEVLENIALAAVHIDAAGRIQYVNPCYERVSGYSSKEVLGRHAADLVPPESAPDIAQLVEKALLEDPDRSAEHEMTSKSGSMRRMLWTSVRLRDVDDRVEGLLTLGADVTEQRSAEADRDRAMKELTELKDRLAEENLYLRKEIQVAGEHSEIVGNSDVLKYVLAKIEQVVDTDATVLIEGETGVGKDLVAQAIHNGGSRAGHPFIKLNCAALPDHLVESELFGHERGAFTGADRQRKGRFELAAGGSLLLDEVSELPPGTQAKLLRVLQEREFERVGGSQTIKADVRVIAASNRNLSHEVEKGSFRQDLFYRLNVYPITVPPLRDRREDIPLLVEQLVSRIATRLGRVIEQVPGDVVRQLREHDWPGNVRELENILERAVITNQEDGVLRLPEEFVRGVGSPSRAAGNDQTLDAVERAHILTILDEAAWKISGPRGAASRLGLNPSTLRFRMKKLGIERE